MMQESAVTPPVYRNAERESDRLVFQSMLRGAKLKCPACGVGALYRRFLKVSDACPNCGEELHHHRADDAPPYFTVVIVGHIVVGLVLFVEMTYRPPLWVHAALWAPLTIILALVLLPPIKGALIGLQWALRMHGFDPNATGDGIERFVIPDDQQVSAVRLPRS
ncbi:MAG TPA: DUF983 domain-containing protein [Methyloceanibacter sp.]|jgi:uncharacterized protein (DUF983 family)|nr:DUF983 domain-containing protein [Methyloceanibacter sp.]